MAASNVNTTAVRHEPRGGQTLLTVQTLNPQRHAPPASSRVYRQHTQRIIGIVLVGMERDMKHRWTAPSEHTCVNGYLQTPTHLNMYTFIEQVM